MFCFHKYDKEIKDGYQFCTKCGKAHSVVCVHEWKTIHEYNVTTSTIGGSKRQSVEYHLQCKKCGNLKVRHLE